VLDRAVPAVRLLTVDQSGSDPNGAFAGHPGDSNAADTATGTPLTQAANGW
jgi:hypothetical protein